jgi:uncharacterized protein
LSQIESTAYRMSSTINTTEKIKIALITGGSSGIGLAMAHELAKLGNNLLLVSNQQKELEQSKSDIEGKYQVKCFTHYCDLAKSGAAYDIFDYCNQNIFEVEILINNAGMLLFSEVVSAPSEKIDIKLNLHMVTPTLLCRLFGEQMKQRRHGYILNVSSISAVMPYPGISLYGPTKTYIRYFTRAFRTEMNVHNVKVTCLLPGATATGLYDPNRVNLNLALRLGVMHQPEFVARKAIQALLENKAESIPGIMNKFVVVLFPYIPNFLISLIYRKTNLVAKGNSALG